MSLNKQKLTVSLPYTILGLIVLCMVLTGCNLSEPTNLSDSLVRVQEEKFADTLPVSSLNKAAVSGLARHYRKHGDGPLELVVTYDPKSSSGSAMHASDAAAQLVKEMRAVGISSVDAGILPVNGQGDEMNAMISYMSYNALAPKDCEPMAGFNDKNIEVEEDYKLGCAIETAFAQQIARPKDLKGRNATSMTTDGRRSANTIEVYRTGVPNEPLEGEMSTEN